MSVDIYPSVVPLFVVVVYLFICLFCSVETFNHTATDLRLMYMTYEGMLQCLQHL